MGRASVNERHLITELMNGLKAVDWRLILFCLSFFVLFLFLGFWQLDRAEEKTQLLAQLETKRSQIPIEDLEDYKGSAEQIDGLPVFLKGHYVPDSVILLDNVVLGGKVGFDLLLWFQEADTNRRFLVNRGFVQMGRTRAELPVIPALKLGSNSLLGHIYAREYATDSMLPVIPLVVAANEIESRRVSIAQHANPLFLATTELFANEQVGTTYPHLIRLALDDPNGLARNWIIANITSEKHMGYAIQWFLMASAIVILLIKLALKQGSDPSNTDNQNL
jgi:surfeit locus 1 family protein